MSDSLAILREVTTSPAQLAAMAMWFLHEICRFARSSSLLDANNKDRAIISEKIETALRIRSSAFINPEHYIDSLAEILEVFRNVTIPSKDSSSPELQHASNRTTSWPAPTDTSIRKFFEDYVLPYPEYQQANVSGPSTPGKGPRQRARSTHPSLLKGEALNDQIPGNFNDDDTEAKPNEETRYVRCSSEGQKAPMELNVGKEKSSIILPISTAELADSESRKEAQDGSDINRNRPKKDLVESQLKAPVRLSQRRYSVPHYHPEVIKAYGQADRKTTRSDPSSNSEIPMQIVQPSIEISDDAPNAFETRRISFSKPLQVSHHLQKLRQCLSMSTGELDYPTLTKLLSEFHGLLPRALSSRNDIFNSLLAQVKIWTIDEELDSEAGCFLEDFLPDLEHLHWRKARYSLAKLQRRLFRSLKRFHNFLMSWVTRVLCGTEVYTKMSLRRGRLFHTIWQGKIRLNRSNSVIIPSSLAPQRITKPRRDHRLYYFNWEPVGAFRFSSERTSTWFSEISGDQTLWEQICSGRTFNIMFRLHVLSIQPSVFVTLVGANLSRRRHMSLSLGRVIPSNAIIWDRIREDDIITLRKHLQERSCGGPRLRREDGWTLLQHALSYSSFDCVDVLSVFDLSGSTSHRDRVMQCIINGSWAKLAWGIPDRHESLWSSIVKLFQTISEDLDETAESCNVHFLSYPLRLPDCPPNLPLLTKWCSLLSDQGLDVISRLNIVEEILYSNNPWTIKILIACGMVPNQSLAAGMSPILVALRSLSRRRSNGSRAVSISMIHVKDLLEAGADVYAISWTNEARINCGNTLDSDEIISPSKFAFDNGVADLWSLALERNGYAPEDIFTRDKLLRWGFLRGRGAKSSAIDSDSPVDWSNKLKCRRPNARLTQTSVIPKLDKAFAQALEALNTSRRDGLEGFSNTWYKLMTPGAADIGIRLPSEGFEDLDLHSARKCLDDGQSSGLTQGIRSSIASLHTYLHGFDLTLKRLIRPRLQKGFRRIEWTCTCGKPMYRDFHSSSLGADQYPHHQAVSAPAQSSSTQRQERQNDSNSYRTRSSTQPLKSTATQNAAPNLRLSPQVHDEDSASSTNQTSRIDIKHRFLELCVNTGQYTISLGELDLTKVKNDGELFALVAQKYRELRRKHIKRLLMRPINVHFVLFSLKKTYRVGIHGTPMVLPPKEELDNKRYEFICEYPPPMDHREFLHYFHNHSSGHPDPTYLERLPKKLGAPLQVPQIPGLVYGWGIHIIEGPNRVLLTWCCVVVLVTSFLVSVVSAIIMKTQEQGFGIGQWMVAVLSSVLVALYFQWEEE